MPGYDLSKLTEFSHALIYGFDPEGSPQAGAGSKEIQDTLYPQVSQHVDLLDAYRYAQDTILADMKKVGIEALQVSQIKEWINGIHRRLGKTLLACYKYDSGKYSDVPVFRWRSGGDIQDNIHLFMADLIRPRKSLDAFVSQLSNDYPVKRSDLKDFMLLLKMLQKDDSIELSRSQKKMLVVEQSHKISFITFSRLQAYYYSDRISKKEKECINKIVKICMPAEQYESAMDLFCANLIKRLKTIDKDNLDEVVDFIADAFYNLTEIHPYPNCNGRTATCFMNILLRYLEKPSILMRYPRERDNPESIYSKIFESNDVDMDLLKKHLKQRILDTQEKPFVHPLLKMLIDHRIALMFLLKRIEKNHPECDINQSYFKIINSLNPAVLMAIAAQQTEQLILLTQGQPDDPKNSDHLTAILSIQYVMAEVDKLEKRLNLEKAKSVPPTAANICKQLAAISGTDSSSWKAYQKSTVFIFESAVEADVVTAIDILNKEDTGCTISKLKRADNGRHVIKIEKINPLKLFSIDPDLRAAKSNDPEEHKGFAP